MAGAFSQENAVDIMDLIADLQDCMGDTKQQIKAGIREKYTAPTTGMAVIVSYADIGEVCVNIKTAQEFHD
eukprot:5936853-Heterocapsa_arctica.AAC.2